MHACVRSIIYIYHITNKKYRRPGLESLVSSYRSKTDRTHDTVWPKNCCMVGTARRPLPVAGETDNIVTNHRVEWYLRFPLGGSQACTCTPGCTHSGILLRCIYRKQSIFLACKLFAQSSRKCMKIRHKISQAVQI